MKEKIRVRHKEDKVHISGEIAWKYTQDPASKRFIAVCPSLHITLEADSVNDLLPLMSESMEAIFTTTVNDGTLDAFLKGAAWKSRTSKQAKYSALMNIPRIVIDPVTPHDLEIAACG